MTHPRHPPEAGSPTPAPPIDAHAAFAALLPRLLPVLRSRLRRVRCPHRRADRAADALALCWLWAVRLAARRRDPRPFAARLADFAARAALGGRGVCGSEPVTDVGSSACMRRHGVAVTPLAVAEAVADNARTPVPDRVQFRLDFPAWVRTLPPAKRRLLARLLAGERTAEVAAAAGLSASRVSQVRAELRADYARFCGDPC